MTWNVSPGCGSAESPSTSTGVDGPAFLTLRPRWSKSARTLPSTVPAMKRSPSLIVPSCTSTLRDRTAAAIELRFEHGALRHALRVGLEVGDVGDEQEHLEQLIEVLALPRRDLDRDRRAAPFFRHQPEVRQLALDALGIRVRLVDLVHRDDDRHVGRLRVVDRFPRLRHDAVVGRDDQDDDVGDAWRRGRASS